MFKSLNCYSAAVTEVLTGSGPKLEVQYGSMASLNGVDDEKVGLPRASSSDCLVEDRL